MSQDLEGKEEVFQGLLEEHNAVDFVLPDLKAETSWFEYLVNDFFKWLDSFTKQEMHIDFNSLFFILKLVVFFALALSVVFLTYRLIKRLWGLNLKEELKLKKAGEQLTRSLEQIVQDKIEWAKKVKDLAEASRLRWKLFLVRTSQSHDLTPAEFLASPSSKMRGKLGLKKDSTIFFDRLMFSKQRPSHDDFKIMDSHLSRLEGLETQNV